MDKFPPLSSHPQVEREGGVISCVDAWAGHNTICTLAPRKNHPFLSIFSPENAWESYVCVAVSYIVYNKCICSSILYNVHIVNH